MPTFWEDLGTHVIKKTEDGQRAGNLIYSKDIVIDFELTGAEKNGASQRKWI